MTYIELLTEFVEGTLDVYSFSEIFLDKFKKEDSFASDKEFQILDKFFGDVDFCDSSFYETDIDFDPNWDLTKEELRLSAQETLNVLRGL